MVEFYTKRCVRDSKLGELSGQRGNGSSSEDYLQHSSWKKSFYRRKVLPMSNRVESSLYKAVWLNCAAIAGIVIGLWSGHQSLPSEALGRLAVFVLATFNLLFLVAQPRVTRSSEANTVFREAWAALSERPLVTVLVALQLWAVGRFVGAVITLGKAYGSSQAAAQNLQGRVLLGLALLAAVGLLWLVGAAGLWQTRRWAWWLVLVLNALAAGTSVVIQLFRRDEFLVDPVALAMICFLLLPATRIQFMTQRVLPPDSSRDIAAIP